MMNISWSLSQLSHIFTSLLDRVVRTVKSIWWPFSSRSSSWANATPRHHFHISSQSARTEAVGTSELQIARAAAHSKTIQMSLAFNVLVCRDRTGLWRMTCGSEPQLHRPWGFYNRAVKDIARVSLTRARTHMVLCVYMALRLLHFSLAIREQNAGQRIARNFSIISFEFRLLLRVHLKWCGVGSVLNCNLKFAKGTRQFSTPIQICICPVNATIIYLKT